MKNDRISILTFGSLIAGLVWSYWPTLGALVRRWESDPRYAHGYLVPLFSAVLLWRRRDQFKVVLTRSVGTGILLIAVGTGLRLVGTYYYVDWLEAFSILPALAGACVLPAGRPALRWVWPAIAFLIFAIPMPYGLEKSLGLPMQRFATVVSTLSLQTMGFPAVAEGNVIALGEWRVGIVEACNGMGIMLLFFAFSTGTAMLIQRPLLDRMIVVASAVPIALIANVTRITLTGVLHELVGPRVADFVYHDLAGWLMMPIAMLLLFIELQLLSLLLVSVATPETTSSADGTGSNPSARDRDPEVGSARPAATAGI